MYLINLKLGVTPNPNKFFVSAGLRRTTADRRKKIMGVRGYPQFFDSMVGGTPTFLAKM